MNDQVDQGSRRFRRSGAVIALVVLTLVILTGGALAVGRSMAPTTTPQSSAIHNAAGAAVSQSHSWARQHPGQWQWMREHPGQWNWMLDHMDDMPWLRHHPASRQWMRDHMDDMPWLRAHSGQSRWPGHHDSWSGMRQGMGHMMGGQVWRR